jgi:CheY-like chemotaxis protein
LGFSADLLLDSNTIGFIRGLALRLSMTIPRILGNQWILFGEGKVVRVLVAEDDPLVLLSIAEFLRDEGFEVIEAHTGEKALALFPHHQRIHVLLTDIRMPGRVDGWELARRIRDQDPDVAVIYVTGYSDLPASPVSGSLFFNKPYRMERIIEDIHALHEHPKISAGSPRHRG